MSRLRLPLALLLFAASDARAQRLVLELRPHFGDTVRMRFDQTTEMSGTRKGVATKAVVTTLRMFSRAIVESSSPASALILAITDSVDVRTTDERARPLASETQRLLAGRQMRLRLSPDGTVGVADQQPNVPKEVSELVAVMPASFPRGSVAVGDTWLREMPIPPSATFGVPLGGVVKAAFKLDSISEDAEVAYLSMRGSLQQVAEQSGVNSGALTGSVNGSMVVDRRRGWLSESRFLLQMRATVASVGAKGAATDPMQFRMKITQHMRVSDKR
ncbi:MAG: hypothetical protein WD825_07745 [Gemmatimonadaceae bacterium]